MFNIFTIFRRFVLVFIISSLFISLNSFCQDNAVIMGSIKDKETQELLTGAVVALENTSFNTETDSLGRYKIGGLAPKTYNLLVQYIGYKPQTFFNIVVSNGNATIINIELERSSELKEVVVKTNTFGKRAETPLSVQSLSAQEIKSNPGGNYDISRVIQALPGVGGTSGGAARNDLIIRGGAPNENVYYLDGVEVPQINHFSTQGASGGAQGILNVSFIEDVTLSTSSFAAKYDNALSSVLQFKQRDGNPDKLQGNARLSSTDVAGTLEGPINKNTTFLSSVRRSYLQYLFQAIDLPIRPNYWDFQYKVTHKFDSKTTLTAIGIGAIDEFSFATPKNASLENEYIIRSLPTINQYTYTIGFSLKRLIDHGYYMITASRNSFNNRLDQFEDADFDNESKRTYKLRSFETENKLRFEENQIRGKWKISYGASVQYVQYSADLFYRLRKEVNDSLGHLLQPALLFNYNSAISFARYGLFGSVNRRMLNNRLLLTMGIRTDMNSFMKDGNNPINAISPRIATSYAISSKFNLNASIGRYAKIPIYTVLGYKDSLGNLLNKENKYILCDHYVAGIEYLPTNSLRLTVEGFYKQYSNYPVSVKDGISLANEGGGFGAIGNERTTATGSGRSYGLELFIQQKLVKNFFITASYTLFQSEFTGTNNQFIASSWDTRHLLSLILGRKFSKGWEAGAKYRLAGGAPYTPFDMAASQINYATTGQGVPDYSRINQQRLPFFNQLDLRIDKKYNFKKSSLDIYFDFQNAALAQNQSPDYYTFKRNPDNSYATTDGKVLRSDGSNAIPVLLKNVDNTFTPSLGVIFEF